MHRCMIGTETVFIIAIIDSNLNRHRCVYQTNDSGRNSDEVCVSAVRGTSESAGAPKKVSTSLLARATFRKLMGECLDIISGKWQLLPSNISYKASPNDQDGFLIRSVNLTVLDLVWLGETKSIASTLRMIPNSVIESTMLKKVGIVFAFSPILVLCILSSRP